MQKLIGIRREDKNIWEKRVPLIPEHIKELNENYSIKTILQPFAERAFSNEKYIDAGAKIDEDLSACPVILAVKEIPIDLIMRKKIYLFFSHTIKGQSYNMPLLKKFIESKSTLIDYECIANEQGRRLVFFGKYAGLAGMIDTLYGLGRRFQSLGFDTPFLDVKPAYEYEDLNEAKDIILKVGDNIKKIGLPDELIPVVVGFAGYGNVSQGAQEIFDLLPHKELQPEQLGSVNKIRSNILYKTVFKEEHMVEPVDPNDEFALNDYFQNPEKYRSKFDQYLDKITVLVNAIYWNEKYPRFLTKKYFKEQLDSIKLKVVSDITCDINGAVEFTEKATESDNPAFVYNPKTGEIKDGFDGEGILDIAVDNLPAELPRDASRAFSNSLYPFINGILKADIDIPFEKSNLPSEIKRAVIVYKGELTKSFTYLTNYLN